MRLKLGILITLLSLGACSSNQKRYPAGNYEDNITWLALSQHQEKIYYDRAIVNALTSSSAIVMQEVSGYGDVDMWNRHFKILKSVSDELMQEITTYLPYVKDEKVKEYLKTLLTELESVENSGYGDVSYWTAKVKRQEEAFKRINSKFSSFLETMPTKKLSVKNAEMGVLLELKMTSNIAAKSVDGYGDIDYWVHNNKVRNTQLKKLKKTMEESVTLLDSKDAKSTIKELIADLNYVYSESFYGDTTEHANYSSRINKTLTRVKDQLGDLLLRTAKESNFNLENISKEKLLGYFELVGKQEGSFQEGMSKKILNIFDENDLSIRDLLTNKNENIKRGAYTFLLETNLIDEIDKNMDLFYTLLDQEHPYFSNKFTKTISKNFIDNDELNKQILISLLNSKAQRDDLFGAFSNRVTNTLEYEDLLVELMSHKSRPMREFAMTHLTPVVNNLSDSNLQQMADVFKSRGIENLEVLKLLKDNKQYHSKITVYLNDYIEAEDVNLRMFAQISLVEVRTDVIYPGLLQELDNSNPRESNKIITILDSFHKNTAFTGQLEKYASSYLLSKETDTNVKNAAILALKRVNANTTEEVNEKLTKLFKSTLTTDKAKLNTVISSLLENSENVSRSQLKKLKRFQKDIKTYEYHRPYGSLSDMALENRVSHLVSAVSDKKSIKASCAKMIRFFM